jgi:hypothetical protein
MNPIDANTPEPDEGVKSFGCVRLRSVRDKRGKRGTENWTGPKKVCGFVLQIEQLDCVCSPKVLKVQFLQNDRATGQQIRNPRYSRLKNLRYGLYSRPLAFSVTFSHFWSLLKSKLPPPSFPIQFYSVSFSFIQFHSVLQN